MQSTRRLWLSQCVGIAALAEVAAAQQHAHEAVQSASPPTFQTLDPATATEIDAITSQIIPSTDGPGAREAGVVYFIDRALSTFDGHLRDAYRTGMAEVQQKRKELFSKSTSTATLTNQQQIQPILRTAADAHSVRLPRQPELRRQSRSHRVEVDRL